MDPLALIVRTAVAAVLDDDPGHGAAAPTPAGPELPLLRPVAVQADWARHGVRSSLLCLVASFVALHGAGDSLGGDGPVKVEAAVPLAFVGVASVLARRAAR